MLSIEIGVVLPLARAVEILVAALMQLHALAIEFFLNDERAPLHFFDCFFDSSRWPLAEHRGEGAKELDRFVLWRVWQMSLGWE